MAIKYNINGFNMEDLLVIDNTNGADISTNPIGYYKSNSANGFPNKYKKKFGDSKYSKTILNYKINGDEQGKYFAPKATVFLESTTTTEPFTLSSGTTHILAICLGGGGGGTGGTYIDPGESGGAGGGGGGGGLAWVYYKLNNALRTINVIVGGGGAGGERDNEGGKKGNNGNLSSVKYNDVSLCIGYGGLAAAANTNSNNAGGNGGGSVSGYVSNHADVITSGVKSSAHGGPGQDDPNNGSRSQQGVGGAGANGGSNNYEYGGKDGDPSDTDNVIIEELKFDGQKFLNDGQIIDALKPGFIATEFKGTGGTLYGRGGNGGDGEGQNNGTSEDGNPGNKGFVIIVEYGFQIQ